MEDGRRFEGGAAAAAPTPGTGQKDRPGRRFEGGAAAAAPPVNCQWKRR